MSAKNDSKEAKQIAVAKAILELVEREGLLGITHSKVSRISGVSRAWIYEYIGKEKGSLAEYATQVFAEHIARIKVTEIPKNKNEFDSALKEAVEFLFDFSEQNPTVIKLYFRFRGTTNPIGKVIEKYEKHWLETASKSSASVLGLDAKKALSLAELTMTVRLGFAHRIATSGKPKLEREKAKAIFDYIHAMV